MNLEDDIRNHAVALLGIDPEDLTHGFSLFDTLGLDSLDLAEWIGAVEERFGITLPARAIERVRTFDDLVDAVRNTIASRTRAHLPDPTLTRATHHGVWITVHLLPEIP